MYCPKCGMLNIEDAKYCRACGADISLVPQALTKSLPEGAQGVLEVEEEESGGRKGRKYKFKEPPTLEKGLGKVFEGIAHLMIVTLGFIYFKGWFFVWIWFLIPALSSIGEGIGQLIRAGREPKSLQPQAPFRSEAVLPPAPQPAGELAAPDTSDMGEHPFSITEGTTRHLDAARPTQK